MSVSVGTHKVEHQTHYRLALRHIPQRTFTGSTKESRLMKERFFILDNLFLRGSRCSAFAEHCQTTAIVCSISSDQSQLLSRPHLLHYQFTHTLPSFAPSMICDRLNQELSTIYTALLQMAAHDCTNKRPA